MEKLSLRKISESTDEEIGQIRESLMISLNESLKCTDFSRIKELRYDTHIVTAFESEIFAELENFIEGKVKETFRFASNIELVVALKDWLKQFIWKCSFVLGKFFRKELLVDSCQLMTVKAIYCQRMNNILDSVLNFSFDKVSAFQDLNYCVENLELESGFVTDFNQLYDLI